MNYLEIIGTTVGLAYLWLEYKASIYLWVAGLIMPAIYIVVYYEAGLYADAGINVYYLLAGIYGIYYWIKQKNSGSSQVDTTELPITYTPRHTWPRLVLTFVLAFVALSIILMRFTDSDVPVWDAFTTALSIVGMWMLARKHIEQWWIWIVVDVVCVGLYLYKELYFTAGLYALYSVIAFLGYKKWKELMKQQA
ncbi:MAG: nicotinamide mononucleotide transporter [Paraprevotella sp.]|nr:nicotinamide mononucleotide transporter [Paraprevotella sp.]